MIVALFLNNRIVPYKLNIMHELKQYKVSHLFKMQPTYAHNT